MSDMGLMHYFLGLEVRQGLDGVCIYQRKYVEGLLYKFNMQQCKKVLTLMNANEEMQVQDGSGIIDTKKYRALIGGLNYLIHTRPDSALSVSLVSRYMSNLTRIQYAEAKRILYYIAGTINFGLWYDSTSNFKLIGFIDSDWAQSLDDQRSTLGNICMLGSSTITWGSKRQGIIALSTTEA